MKHAKFTFQLTTQGSRRCLVIIDTRGFFENCKTVTNDIELVIDQIELTAGIRAEDFVVVYCDNAGRWDGWDARAQKFVLLNAPDWPAAVRKYVVEKLKPQHA